MYKQAQFVSNSTKCIRAVMLLPIAATAVAMYWSLRLTIANGFEEGVDLNAAIHAIALVPGNDAYLRRAAELTDEVGGDGAAYYRKAITVDPYASHDWVQLGFDAERDGRSRDSEQDLLQAAHVDRTFEPRWALANFYFRRGDTTSTLRWVTIDSRRRSYRGVSSLLGDEHGCSLNSTGCGTESCSCAGTIPRFPVCNESVRGLDSNRDQANDNSGSQ